MTRRLLLAFLAALAAPAQADVVRANTTTLFYTRQVPYPGELERASPLFELVSITASEVTAPFADDVEIALSTWGAVELGDIRRWQNGATSVDRRVSGDVDVGYVKGALLGRRLVLQLGRQLVADGTARIVHVDGAQARLRLPFGFGLSAYAGSPVPPRFAARGGELMTGNHRANFATGGRVSWFYPGVVEVGASAALARDRGDVARQDVGADLRLYLPQDLVLVGSSFYSLYEERLGEADVSLGWRGSRRFQATVDYRHIEPDLLLSRTSILSVFAEDERDDVGGAIRIQPVRAIVIDADYHTLLQREGTGHRARLKGTWRPREAWDVGGETVLLRAEDSDLVGTDGYWLARAFAAWRQRAFDVTADVMSVVLDRRVNEEKLSLEATATVAWKFFPGWKVLVAGTGGTTPSLIRHFDVLAKLVYDQTYVTREVP